MSCTEDVKEIMSHPAFFSVEDDAEITFPLQETFKSLHFLFGATKPGGRHGSDRCAKVINAVPS